MDSIKQKQKEIRKPIIYSEGHNYRYLEKAKEFFASELDIEILDCGGKNDLQKIFKLFAKTNFDRFKVFFVFDCDATTPYRDCNDLKTSKSLIPYIFKKNLKNNIVEIQSGIENLFDEEIILDKEENALFDVTETRRNGTIISRNRYLRKPEFEKYIIEERNRESDFYNFKELYDLISKV